MIFSALKTVIFGVAGIVTVAAVIFLVRLFVKDNGNKEEKIDDNIEKIVDEQAKQKRNANSSLPIKREDTSNQNIEKDKKEKKADEQDVDCTKKEEFEAHLVEETSKVQETQPLQDKELHQPSKEIEKPHKNQAVAEVERKREDTRYRVIFDKETKTWIIKKDGAKRTIRRVRTKEEALKIAKELSKSQDKAVVVHKKDGKFQKQ